MLLNVIKPDDKPKETAIFTKQLDNPKKKKPNKIHNQVEVNVNFKRLNCPRLFQYFKGKPFFLYII